MPRLDATHFDNAGREWEYTIKGWEIIDGEFDPVVKMTKLEAVVAHRSKQPWLDISNKSLWPEYKWDWFENRVSGYNVWGKMDGGDIDLGNEQGENSFIEGNGIDSNDFGAPGPRGAKTKYLGHLTNDFSYVKDAARRASRGANYTEKLYDEFKPNTQYQLDSIYKDSIFQNEMVRYDEEYIFNVIPKGWGGWNDNKLTQINTRFRDDFTKRKDSAKAIKNNKIIILKKVDSILNKKK